jgi:glucosyl-3-phosphoglycerate synthase
MPPADGTDAASDDHHFTVLIPVLDEELTIAGVVDAAIEAGASAVIVVDSGSRDHSVRRAGEAGATVATAADLPPGGRPAGKGDTLWRGLALVDTPFTVFLDGDLAIDGPDFIGRLLAPLFDGSAVFAKASFTRVPLLSGAPKPGRVTALVAKPLLRALYPELADLDEPLSGQVAAPTEVLRGLPFEVDYGLEIGMLIDVCRAHGRAAVAHPDCGELAHVPQADADLEAMADQVVRAALARSAVPAAGAGSLVGHPVARPPYRS